MPRQAPSASSDGGFASPNYSGFTLIAIGNYLRTLCKGPTKKQRKCVSANLKSMTCDKYCLLFLQTTALYDFLYRFLLVTKLYNTKYDKNSMSGGVN
jgi:hypothetical protein